MENKLNEAAAKAQNTETENAAANNAAAIVEPATAETKTEAKTEAKKAKAEPKAKKDRKAAREEMEEKQLEARETQRGIEERKKELTKCLNELNRKKQLADHRDLFLATLIKLDEAEDLLVPGEFETKRIKLKIFEVKESGYGHDGFDFSISNSHLIKEFIIMLRDRVQDKIRELEAELVM